MLEEFRGQKMDDALAVGEAGRLFSCGIVLAGGGAGFAVLQPGIDAVAAVQFHAVFVIQIIMLRKILAGLTNGSFHDDHLKTIIEFITLKVNGE